MDKGLRRGVRAIVARNNRLFLVNAYRVGTGPELWCAPGGGVEPLASWHNNLRRELHEETGLDIEVGPVALVIEFYVPEGIVRQRRFFA